MTLEPAHSDYCPHALRWANCARCNTREYRGRPPTICATCGNLHGDAKRDGFWRWLCMAAPRELEFSFVTGRQEGEPYRRCRDLNNGDCPAYRQGDNCLSPGKLVEVRSAGRDVQFVKVEQEQQA